MNDAAVVRKVATTMIPVALNTDRIPDDDAGKFFQAAMKTSRWPQGIWIVAPDGKVLAFHYFRVASGESPTQGKVRWLREMLEAIDTGLKAFGEVSQREMKHRDPLPDRGIGKRDDGGIRLAAYATYTRNGKRDGDPVVDSVILSVENWKSFQPPKLELGSEWSISEAAAKRFAPVLSPITDSIFAPLPKDAKSAKLTCTIEGVEPQRILIRLTGGWETEHFRDNDPKLPIRASASADGYAEFDRGQKRITSVVLVFKGAYRNVPPWDAAKPTAAVVEWKRTLAERKE